MYKTLCILSMRRCIITNHIQLMNAIVQSALSPNPLSSFWNVGQKLTCASRTRTHDDRGSKLYPRLRESPELLTQPHQRCTLFSEREERGLLTDSSRVWCAWVIGANLKALHSRENKSKVMFVVETWACPTLPNNAFVWVTGRCFMHLSNLWQANSTQMNHDS